MKTLFIILFSLLASSSAIANEVFVDQIDEDWAYVCENINERWTCKDVRVRVLEDDYGIVESINHGWFNVPPASEG
tara:strand:- start:606 stop:833 length:228 start_codon:yes stop_codon:yes gene_type:complete